METQSQQDIKSSSAPSDTEPMSSSSASRIPSERQGHQEVSAKFRNTSMTSSSAPGEKSTSAISAAKGSSSGSTAGSSTSVSFREVLPKRGYLHCEDELTFVLCKPKLLPLKSFTMEKLEKIQTESIEKAKEEMENSLLD